MGYLTLPMHYRTTKRFLLHQKPRAARRAAIVRTAGDTAPGRTQRTQTVTKEGHTVHKRTNKDTQDTPRTQGHTRTNKDTQGHKQGQTRTKTRTHCKKQYKIRMRKNHGSTHKDTQAHTRTQTKTHCQKQHKKTSVKNAWKDTQGHTRTHNTHKI